MLVIFPLIFAAMAAGLVVLFGLLGQAGAQRYGGFVSMLCMAVPLLGVAIALRLLLDDSLWAETRGHDDYGRMAAWAIVAGTGALGLVSLGMTVLLVARTAAAARRDGGLVRDSSGFAATLRRGIMTVVWTITGFIGTSIALMIPLQLVFGDDIPESANGLLGLAVIAGGVLGLVLSLRGTLPGTRRPAPAQSGKTIPSGVHR